MGGMIIGTGHYVPEKVLTNADLEKMVDTSHDWIVSRTGIEQRHVADPSQATSDLCAEAGKQALKAAGLTAADLDLIVVATATPDMFFPSTACIVQKKMGTRKIAAFDISAACCGFLYGLSLTNQFVSTGEYKNVLLIGAETLSKIVDWTDRGTCVLFGDGAGAIVLGQPLGNRGVLATHLWADGGLASLLDMPAGGSRIPTTHESIDQGLHHLKMEGTEVFKHAVRVMMEGIGVVMKKAGITNQDVSLFIPHQANLRIIQAIADRLEFPAEKVFININRYGNTSAASIGIGLNEAVRSGRVKPGDIVVMSAFGAGMTMAAAAVRI